MLACCKASSIEFLRMEIINLARLSDTTRSREKPVCEPHDMAP